MRSRQQEDGMPTMNAKGKELTEKELAALQKKYDAAKPIWDTYQAQVAHRYNKITNVNNNKHTEIMIMDQVDLEK